MKKKTEVQRWLESARLLEESIRCDLDDLAAYRSSAEKRTAMLSLTGGATATGERTMEDAVIGIVLQKEKIREKLARLEALEQEMMSIFGRLADPAQRQLMTLRYVKERSWLYIAEKLNISRATVYRLHEAALREVEKLYEEERSARGKGGTASG